MATTILKRKLSSRSRSVSPPRLRQRISNADREVIRSPPETSVFRFYSWNVNGINPLLQKKISFQPSGTTGLGSPYPLRAFLREYHWPHALCLQEVKISPSDYKTQRLVEAAANFGNQPSEPTYTTHFSLPRDKHNATGFGGKVHGVATLIRDSTSLLPSRTTNAIGDNTSTDVLTSRPEWDLEGRVLIHEFADVDLVLVNGYWVNGTSNPYRDPKTGAVTGTRHDHKLRFHAHMLQLCDNFELKGKRVLLIGDMNIAPARIDGYPNLRTSSLQHVENRADFNQKFLGQDEREGFRGVDVFRHLHGEKKKFTYHGRGRPWGESCDRVDLIVASRQLVDEGVISGSDICDTPQDRGHSDHVPLWIDVDVSMLRKRGCDTTVGHTRDTDHA